MSAPERSSLPFPLGAVRAANRALERAEGVVLVTALSLMVTLAFTQVLLRVLRPINSFFQPVAWFGPFTQYLVVWVGLIGASIASREGRHFGVEVLTKTLDARGRRRLDAFLASVALVFTVSLAVLSWNHLLLRELRAVAPVFVVESFLGLELHLRVMRWQLLVVVPLELSVMSLRFLLRVLEASLLDDATWEEHDHSLRPELERPESPAARHLMHEPSPEEAMP